MTKEDRKKAKRRRDKDQNEFMPEPTPNTNPDDIEIGDEISPEERLKKERNKEDH